MDFTNCGLHRNSPQDLNISSISVFGQIRDPEIRITLRPLTILIKLKPEGLMKRLTFCEDLLIMFGDDETIGGGDSFIRNPQKSVTTASRELQRPESIVFMHRRYYPIHRRGRCSFRYLLISSCQCGGALSCWKMNCFFFELRH